MSKDSSAKYYQKNKEKLQKKLMIYQDPSEEEKNKKWHYGRERYKNLPEDVKQRLVEYRKKYCRYGKINPLHK